MERKSAWSLPMSEQEIVNEYKNAKKPQTQIAILADQNSCDKKTIVNILELNGCELPGNFRKKKKVLLEEDPEEPYRPPFVIKEASEEAPDFAKVQPEPANEEPKEEPLPTSVQIKLAALRAIDNMVSEDFGDERGRSIFAERVAGILEFVKEVEHGKI